MHKILGNILVVIQRNLFDKNFESPKTNGVPYSSYVNQRLYESGEYMQCNYLENY